MVTERALLDAVLADPGDDASRLIYADWLEEQGEAERAEFIKVQCALARLPPGHVCLRADRIRPRASPQLPLPLEAVVPLYRALEGGVRMGDTVDLVHEAADRTGALHWFDLRVESWEQDVLRQDVVLHLYRGGKVDEHRARREALRRRERELVGEDVSGDGRGVLPRYQKWCQDGGVDPRWVRTPGFNLGADLVGENHFRRGFVEVITLPYRAFLDHAADLFRAQPITEVRLSDRRPSENRYRPGRWAWLHPRVPRAPETATLPAQLFRLLEVRGPGSGGRCKWYDGEADALADLSAAAVAYGRGLAGLPALPRPALVS